MVNARKNLKSGSAIAVAIIVVLLLAFAGLTMMLMGYNERVRATYETQELAARAAADAGISQSLYLLGNQYSTGKWVGPLPPDVTVPANLAGSGAQYTYTITSNPSPLSAGAKGFTLTVTATGTCGRATKTVHCLFKDEANLIGGGFNDIVSTGNNFHMVGSGAAMRTNSNAIGAITIGGGNTAINGNLVAWDGDPKNNKNANTNINAVIDSPDPVAPYTKQFSASQSTYPPVIVPAALDSAPTLPASIPASPSTPLSYKASADVPGLTVPANTSVTLYIKGKNLTGNVSVAKGGKLVIYMDGNVGDPGINGLTITSSETNPVTAAGAISILGTSNCLFIGAKNNIQCMGLLYAPSATISAKNSDGITGAMVGDKFDIKNMNNAAFTYIQQLMDDFLTPARVLVQSRWWEE